MTTIEAWHFVGATLRDGRPIPADGETLRHDGPLKLRRSGLHGSRCIIDALRYARGETICRVVLSGEIEEELDKLVASERTILWRMDATELLREFARRCALDVAHLWDAPEIVLDYLRSGDETKRDAARDAAWDAAWAAAEAAAKAAAEDAAEDAARAAARAAAGAAQNDRLTQMVEAAREVVS